MALRVWQKILYAVVLIGLGLALAFFRGGYLNIFIFSALINASNQAIWQAKVAPDVQGRVFSARRLIAWFTQPIAPVIAGTLADYVMEPAMASDTLLSGTFGGLVGTGPGSGMGLLLVFSGLAAGLVGLSGYFVPAIRNAEQLLPDHDQLEKAETIDAQEGEPGPVPGEINGLANDPAED